MCDDGENNQNDQTGAAEQSIKQKELNKKQAKLGGTGDLSVYYASYISLYTSLDTIAWTIPPLFLAVTVIGIGMFGDKLAKADAHFGILTHNQSIGVGLAIIGGLYGLGSYSMRRLRINRLAVGAQLKSMEGDTGYFNSRPGGYSAGKLFINVFAAVAIIAIVGGLIFFL